MAHHDAQLAALDAGTAWVDLSSTHHVFEVTGADARAWLGDLVTGPVASLADAGATRSLLLTPTGRIRADLWVARRSADRFVLLQGTDQPEPVDELLTRYVLSSRVSITAMDTGVLSAPSDGPTPGGVIWSATPSAIDPRARSIGFDTPASARGAATSMQGWIEAGPEAVEGWRVRHGRARFPRDLTAASTPAEDPDAEGAIDSTKGCFLGQEAVAKIRNLGHPTHLVRAFRAPLGTAIGDEVRFADGPKAGEVAGEVSSVAEAGSQAAVLVRYRWPGSRDPVRLQARAGALFEPSPGA